MYAFIDNYSLQSVLVHIMHFMNIYNIWKIVKPKLRVINPNGNIF